MIPPQILHVDDDPDVLERVREYVEGEEIGGWGRAKVTGLASFDDALAELETRRFDLMILDVRLGGHEDQDLLPEEEEGVRTLDQIRERRFLPVIFWTGLPGKVQHLAGPLVHVLDKTDGLNILTDSVRQLFATRLPALDRALRHLVEEEQRRYMWEFVAHHWDELQGDGDHMALAYLLVRRLGRSFSGPGIQRVADELGEHGPAGPEPGKIHAAEMYIAPPLPGTGPGAADLYRERLGHGETWWLVVTPSCDLEHDKAEYVVLAACEPLEDDRRMRAWSESDNRRNREKVRDLVSHKTGGQDDRHLFLPAAPTVPNLVTDFQCVRSVTRQELAGMERVASLASPFAEAVANRFVRYFGRVGTDDLDVESIMAELRSTVSAPAGTVASAEVAPSDDASGGEQERETES